MRVACGVHINVYSILLAICSLLLVWTLTSHVKADIPTGIYVLYILKAFESDFVREGGVLPRGEDLPEEAINRVS